MLAEVRSLLGSLVRREVLHPSRWTWRFYAFAMVVLLSLNLFGGRGIIHGLIVTQEARRLTNEITRTRAELEEMKHEIERFERSDVEKFRALREELGYLRPGEVSVEFVGEGPVADDAP